MAVLQVDDRILFRGRSAAFSAVVSDVRRAAGRSDTAVVVRPLCTLPKRHFPAGEEVVLTDLAGRSWRGVIGGSTDQAIGVLLQQAQSTGDGIDLRFARSDLLSKAKLAKSFQQFDDMLSTVNALGYLHQDLSEEEMEFTVWTYNFLANKLSTILKELRSAEITGCFPARVIDQFYETVKHRLLKHCLDCIKHTEAHLIPFVAPKKRAELYRMIGGFSWLSFYLTDGGDKDAMLAKAVGSYELGIKIIKHCRCAPGDANLLGLVLNLSVIMHDLLNSPSSAYSIALGAVDAISDELLSPDATTAFNRIKENLRIWSSQNDAVVAPYVPEVADVALADEDNEEAVAADNDGALPAGENTNEVVHHQNLGQIEAAAFENENDAVVAPYVPEVADVALADEDNEEAVAADNDGALPAGENTNEVVHHQNLGQIEAAAFENENDAVVAPYVPEVADVALADEDNEEAVAADNDGALPAGENTNEVVHHQNLGQIEAAAFENENDAVVAPYVPEVADVALADEDNEEAVAADNDGALPAGENTNEGQIEAAAFENENDAVVAPEVADVALADEDNEEAVAADNDGALPAVENANEEAMPDHPYDMVDDYDVEDAAAAYALQNANGAADNHLDRFEGHPFDWEKPGNSRHGKNFRDERKKQM